MQAIIFALISYFTWGTGAFIEAIVARRLNSYSLIFWGFILSALILSFYAFFQTTSLNLLTPAILILNVILGVFLIAGSIVYFEAYKVANRAVVGTIAQSFPAVVVILSLIFLGERVTFSQAVSIIIIFVGMFLSAVDISEFRRKTFSINKGFLFAIIAMICWGAYFAFIKIPVEKIGWFWPNYFSFLLFPLIFFYMRIMKIKLEKPTKNNAFFLIIISTVLVRVAEFSYNFAISKGLVVIVAPIAGANLTLFVLLAFLIFKDPIKKQQIIGIITTLVGIVLLSAFSI